MLMGAAEVLAIHRDRLSGTVKFIFQPAEEGPPAGENGGAIMMIEEGVLDGPAAPEAILGLHAWPGDAGTLMYRSGSFMAAKFHLNLAYLHEPHCPQSGHRSSPSLPAAERFGIRRDRRV